STGCASIPRASSGPQERGPKVLLEWADKKSLAAGSDAEKPDPAANGSGAGADTTASNRAAEEPDEIVTDRPDFTEASSTVGKGRVQLEAGYTFTRDRTNGERFSSHSYPETLLRVGVFADWFEFRLGQNFGTEGTTLPDGTRSRAGGADDLYLGVKLGLTEQKAWHPRWP
ncbi:MAG: transporter, partial [Fimbriiglobus sp.]